jgi:hypothetical protein
VALSHGLEDVVSLVQLQTVSALGQAQFHQRFHITQCSDWMDEFSCGALDCLGASRV